MAKTRTESDSFGELSVPADKYYGAQSARSLINFLIGVETMTWECDYPHSDTTWPRSPEKLWESLRGLPDEHIDAITHGNAMRHFQYDPFQHIPREECTVARLRAQATDVNLTPIAGKGGKSPSDYEHGYATVGDIITQMAGAFATPFADDAKA